MIKAPLCSVFGDFLHLLMKMTQFEPYSVGSICGKNLGEKQIKAIQIVSVILVFQVGLFLQVSLEVQEQGRSFQSLETM